MARKYRADEAIFFLIDQMKWKIDGKQKKRKETAHLPQ
jgi:hypothetical protein